MRFEISPHDAGAAEITQASKALLADPEIRQLFPKSDLWLIGFDVFDKDGPESAWYSTIVHDTASGRSVRAEGPMTDPESVNVVPSAYQQPPTEDEFTWGVESMRAHMDWRETLNEEGITAYRPNPPLANIAHPDGSEDRVLTIGLRDQNNSPRHRIMGIKTGGGDVIAEPLGVPAPSDEEDGYPPGSDTSPEAELAERARLRVFADDDDESPLWDLVVVRAPASSGHNGSGVELRNADYKSQRVLTRAHLPILTVEYEDGGPAERLWLREESAFEATGEDKVPGFRTCVEAPRTIVDLESDGGDFRGVAVWQEGQETVIVSQLQAGWHRYIHEWRLHADGTIRPRVRAAAVRNPATGRPHSHQAHWRLDFDILSGPNVVQEFNETPIYGLSNWHTMRFEMARPCNISAQRYWRVRSARQSQGYSLMPAADYSAGDATGAWVLRYHDEEVDDGVGVTNDASRVAAQLDRLVSGESVHSQDVVLWYAARVGQTGRATGPDLVPFNWKESGPGEAFAALEPPPA